MRSRVAVVVVNHNGGDMVLDCIASIRASSVEVEIVVVDNASTDDSPERIEAASDDVRLVRSPVNLGFGGGANLGVRKTSSPYVVVVTTDCILAPDAIERLVDTLAELPRAAVVGPLVRNPDGSVQPSKRSFPTVWQSALHGLLGLVWPGNPGTRAYTLADADLSRPRAVDWVSGATFAARRDAFDEVDGFDEAFFFFVEDVDLCRRLHDRGWEIWFEPRAEVVHAWGGTWTRRPMRFIWLHHRNLWRYITKHYRGAWVLAYPALAAGLGLRFVVMSLRWLVAKRTVPAHRTAKEVRR